jgi:hypothetical protein
MYANARKLFFSEQTCHPLRVSEASFKDKSNDHGALDDLSY